MTVLATHSILTGGDSWPTWCKSVLARHMAVLSHYGRPTFYHLGQIWNLIRVQLFSCFHEHWPTALWRYDRFPYRGHPANYHQYLAFGLLQAAYNCFLHPLAKIPGPKLRAAFYFPSCWEIWTGDIAYNWHGLHETYGDIVRIAPDFVSVIKAEGWRGRIEYISSSC